MDLRNLQDGGALAGLLGGIVTVWGFFGGRNEKRIREIAERAIADAAIDVRLSRIEVTLPRIEEGISEVKQTVSSTNEKLDQLLLGGRLHVRKDRHDDEPRF